MGCKSFSLCVVLFLGMSVTPSFPQIYVDPVVPGGDVSGGGNFDELTPSAIRDDFQAYVLSSSFDSSFARSKKLDPKFLLYVLQNLKIQSVEFIGSLNEVQKPRSMENFWEGHSPRINFVADDFYSRNDRFQQYQLVIHEILGLVYREKNLILDEDYKTSKVLTERVFSFLDGRDLNADWRSQLQKLVSLYETLYPLSGTQPDFMGQGPSGILIALPHQNNEGSFYISKAGSVFSAPTSLEDGGIVVLFDKYPDVMNLDDPQGEVLAYFPAKEGTEQSRFVYKGRSIRKYVFEEILPDSFSKIIKEESPSRFRALESTGRIDEEIQKRMSNFLDGNNNGENGDRYFFGLISDSQILSFAYPVHYLDDVVDELKLAMIKRLSNLPTAVLEKESYYRRRIEQVSQARAEGSISVGSQDPIGDLESSIEKMHFNVTEVLRVGASFEDEELRIATQRAQDHLKEGKEKKSNLNKKVSEEKREAPTEEEIDSALRQYEEIRKQRKQNYQEALSEYQLNASKPRQFYYKMPKSDRARKHSAWDESKAMSIFLVEDLGVDSRFYGNEGLHQFRGVFPGGNKEVTVDFMCGRNSGSLLFEFYSIGELASGELSVGTIGGYWFDFHANRECDKLVDYLRQHAGQITEETPLSIKIDNNSFYRVVEIEHRF